MKFKRLKSILSILLSVAIIGVFIPSLKGISTSALTFTPNFELNSDYAVLYNADIDSIVYQKNATTKTEPAQLTQIMTAIICLEHCSDLENTPVVVPDGIFAEFDKYEEEDPSIFITTTEFVSGEEMTMKDLMYAMLLSSSCEAASTIAYYIGNGDINSFVDMMNAKAKEIGCQNTNFTNPHGLHDSNQYTTAYDMYLITKYATNLSKFNDIANSYEYNMPATNIHDEQVLTHTNVMMNNESDYYYENAKGIKTGNSEQAGSCLVSKATKNGNNYILVLMHAPLSDYDDDGIRRYYHVLDAIKVFNWCLDSFEYKTILSDEEEIKEVKVKYSSGNDYVLLRPKESYSTLWLNTTDTSSVEKKFNINEDISAPIVSGQTLGTVTLVLSGEEVYTTELVATQDVERSFAKFNLAAAQGYGYSVWFKRALVISIFLTFIYFGIYIYKVQSMPKKKRKAKASNSSLGENVKTTHSAPRVKKVQSTNKDTKQ